MFVTMIVVLLHLAILSAMAFLVFRRWGRGTLHKFFFPALAFKLIAGMGLGLIYSYYYTSGDTWGLFKEATTLANQGFQAPGAYLKALFLNDYSAELMADLNYLHQPRVLFSAKLISVLNLITGNNYWLVGLYLSFGSFLAFWWLAQALTDCFPKTKWAAIAAFLFFPSVVFWSSGVSKESLVMGAFCLVLAVLLPHWVNGTKPSLGPWIVALLGLIVVAKIKYYYAALLIPAVIGLFIVTNPIWSSQKPVLKIITGVCGLLLLLGGLSWLHPNLRVDRFLAMVVENGQQMAAMAPDQQYVHYFHLTPDLKGVMINFPWALFSGLFRPLLAEAKTVFQLWVGLENALLLMLCIPHLIYWKRFRKPAVFWAALAYILLLAGFMALAAPNFGTLARYKIGFLPLFVYLVLAFNPWLERATRLVR